jgi:anti-anti-sigma factor
MDPTYFEIVESRAGERQRLSLRGELDLVSTRELEDRLTRLRAKREPVQLDLSQLEFIDSTGLHLLIRTVASARSTGWRFEIEPQVSQPVRRLFKLVHFDPFQDRGEASAEPVQSAQPARDRRSSS